MRDNGKHKYPHDSVFFSEPNSSRGLEYVEVPTYIHVINISWETDISCDQFLQEVLYYVVFFFKILHH